MEQIKILLAIYLLLIAISIVTGAGFYLAAPYYAGIVSGLLLILSSIAILTIFVIEFVTTGEKGSES